MSQTTARQPSFLRSLFQTVSNHFKPHRAEALQRIRVNAFCLLLLFLLSNLLPFPTLQSSVWTVFSSRKPERWASDWIYRWCCVAEATLATISAFNILESLYAIKYPRPAPPPTPARSKNLFKSAPTPNRPFKVLSPNTSPQPQKSFSTSQTPAFMPSASKYPPSPLSTPSRVVQYPPVPPASSTTAQAASSTSSMAFQTPSPVVSAYRGKHAGNVGRALDESFLARIPPPESDDED
ncbi:hypothetical protein LshimejAT787_1300810 [Lyophyllum shimeji]|uniref:Uncharacterized protein n=1 Tax=Lyophyllum shimeji TaxID=47721 RepID=A0A9P3UT39_LYOSH|nr:hypothetical protein LshimejAT787_1300810 [Lyophyllum shimeji]